MKLGVKFFVMALGVLQVFFCLNDYLTKKEVDINSIVACKACEN